MISITCVACCWSSKRAVSSQTSVDVVDIVQINGFFSCDPRLPSGVRLAMTRRREPWLIMMTLAELRIGRIVVPYLLALSSKPYTQALSVYG